jgi:hypothetical protein
MMFQPNIFLEVSLQFKIPSISAVIIGVRASPPFVFANLITGKSYIHIVCVVREKQRTPFASHFKKKAVLKK